MRSLGVNQNNDLYLGPDGNIPMLTGQDAFAQDSVMAMATQMNSCTLNLSYGVDTLGTIWQSYIPALFTAQGRAQLATVPNFVSCAAFDVTAEAGTASYVAEVESIYGPTEIAAQLANSGSNPL